MILKIINIDELNSAPKERTHEFYLRRDINGCITLWDRIVNDSFDQLGGIYVPVVCLVMHDDKLYLMKEKCISDNDFATDRKGRIKEIK